MESGFGGTLVLGGIVGVPRIFGSVVDDLCGAVVVVVGDVEDGVD